jgi:hypothetical protein
MADSYLQDVTGSERLTLDEEFEPPTIFPSCDV